MYNLQKVCALFVCAIVFSLTAGCGASNAQFFDNLKKQAKQVLKNPSALTEKEAVQGLKEALQQGIEKGTNVVSNVDGYFKNPQIKIPFPPEAKDVESKLRSVGLGKEVDKAVLSMNRAAEDAAKEALPIFKNAITGMSISDALGIVKGKEDAATGYLRTKTSNQIRAKFRPIIQNSLEKVSATKYWDDVIKSYNKIPLIKKVNPNLDEFVTEKALDGLFVMVAKEEKNIRENPQARVTEILKKVFGQ